MQEFTLRLTIPEIRVVSEALMEMPFKMVAPVMENLRKQLAEQQNDTGTAPSSPEKQDK